MGSLSAKDITRVGRDEALAFVEQQFGHPSEWQSEVVQYRLTSAFQSFWRAEVGQWLKAAEAHGYLAQFVDNLLKAARRNTRSTGRDPNDRRYLNLLQALAEPCVDHYLTQTGWSFQTWNLQEPVPPGNNAKSRKHDSDLLLRFGQEVSVQVKAPDRPGVVAGRKRYDGEDDGHVLKAIDKAHGQLPRHRAGMIAVCPSRTFPLASAPHCVVHKLLGSTVQREDDISLETPGDFFAPEWAHVSAVMLLDTIVGGALDDAEDAAYYLSTVFLNPNARYPLSPEAFPHASVLELVGQEFVWHRGEPTGYSSIPQGTVLRLVQEPPEGRTHS